MPPSDIVDYNPPKVVGIADDDPEGYIPPDLLQKGIKVIVPIWPVQSPNGREDTLIVQMTRGTTVVFNFRQAYVTPISQLEFEIDIAPQFLIADGVFEVAYQARNFLGNVSNSAPRKLTIDRSITWKLPEVGFPAANTHGYLSCSSNPPIWAGVEVKVPPLPVFCAVNDICSVEWVGYLSLNGSGAPIISTYKRINKVLLTEAEIKNGFSVRIEPFIPHLEPMQNNASALAGYSIYRGTQLKGVSDKGLVKIDRTIPGDEPGTILGICGP